MIYNVAFIMSRHVEELTDGMDVPCAVIRLKHRLSMQTNLCIISSDFFLYK
jgi:hypothetical protein